MNLENINLKNNLMNLLNSTINNNEEQYCRNYSKTKTPIKPFYNKDFLDLVNCKVHLFKKLKKFPNS